MAGTRHRSLTFAEIDELLCLEEDIGDQDSDISVDDNDDDPDYVFDHQIEEEDEELEVNTLVYHRHLHTLLPPKILNLPMPPLHFPILAQMTGFMHPVQGRREGRLDHLVEGNNHLLSK